MIMKNKYLKFIILIVFIIYISAYYVGTTGYYEYHMQEKTILTNNKIKEFERDIKESKDIDIKTYLDTKDIDYTNKLSNIVYDVSTKGTKVARKVIKAIFKKLSYLVED